MKHLRLFESFDRSEYYTRTNIHPTADSENF
jgi:hypothetical protein